MRYLSHLLADNAMAWGGGGNKNQAIATLLHVAIEDAGISAGQIQAQFGEQTVATVHDCTDTDGAMEPAGEKQPWLLRKTRYIVTLEHKPAESVLTTVADKIHKARDIVLDARRDPGQ